MKELEASEADELNDERVMHAMSIDDAYHVERVLASGAEGSTELVTMDGSGPFVRKRIPSKLAHRSVWAALADCSCPRLPQVEATYEMPDEFVVVCDWVPGEVLEKYLGACGRLPDASAALLISQVCEAAAALHARGVVHRDISPANIVMAPDGVHLIDLGIARMGVEGASRDTTPLGTWGFASPEQYGFAQTDARSDVYSIGRLLGYLVTGIRPDSDEYEHFLSNDETVSPRMRAVIARACAFEPSARYQTADELAHAALAAAGSDSGEMGRTWETPSPPSGRGKVARRVLCVAVLVAVVAAALATGWLLASRGADQDAGDDAPASSSAARDGDGASASSDDLDGAKTQDFPSADVAPDFDGSQLEVVESGWSIDEGGFIHYAFALANHSQTAEVEFPQVNVTGRAEDGSALFSNSDFLPKIGPGETVYLAGVARSDIVPSTIEFSPATPEKRQVTEAQKEAPASELSTVGATVVKRGSSDFFVGEVMATGGVSEGGSVQVTIIFRDEGGSIVYGDFTTISEPRAGETTSFEIPLSDVPEYASYEVYYLRD